MTYRKPTRTRTSPPVSCCFDLETTNLSADFGIVLCAVIKGTGEQPVVFRGDAYPNWQSRRSDDSALVRDIVAALSRYDIWVAHNGARFDVPFLRTRLLKWGLPPLPNKKLVDPVLLARNKLRMNFNGLKAVSALIPMTHAKTEVHPELWQQAALDGSRKAMKYIVEHCVQDVLVLEQVVGALKEYSSTYNAYGSGY